MSIKRKIIRKRRQQQQMNRARGHRLYQGLLRRKLWLKSRWINLLHRRLASLDKDKTMKTQQELFE